MYKCRLQILEPISNKVGNINQFQQPRPNGIIIQHIWLEFKKLLTPKVFFVFLIVKS